MNSELATGRKKEPAFVAGSFFLVGLFSYQSFYTLLERAAPLSDQKRRDE